MRFQLQVYDSDPDAANTTALMFSTDVQLTISDINNFAPRLLNLPPYSLSEPNIITVAETDLRNGLTFNRTVIRAVQVVDDDSDLYLPFAYELLFREAWLLKGKIAVDERTGVISVCKRDRLFSAV